MRKSKRPKKRLLEEMINQGMSQAQIARYFGVSRSTPSVWYHRYGLKSPKAPPRYANIPPDHLPKYRRKMWLEEQYVLKRRRTADIAHECGVSPPTSLNALREFNIPIRHKEDPAPYKDKCWLRHQYIVLGKTFREIGKECNVDLTTLSKWAKRLGIQSRDWNEEKANHVELNKEAREFISGELLGDGCIAMNGERSAFISYASQYRSYLEWLEKQLKDFGIRTQYIKQESSNWGSYFHYVSLSYRELVALRNEWYPQGRKRVPTTLKLTPLMCRQWYIGDGTLGHHPGTATNIRFFTNAFPNPDIIFLAEQLRSLGFKITMPRSEPTISIGKQSVSDFLDWIGPCPPEILPIYGYKWDLNHKKQEWIERIRPMLMASYHTNKEKGGDYA